MISSGSKCRESKCRESSRISRSASASRPEVPAASSCERDELLRCELEDGWAARSPNEVPEGDGERMLAESSDFGRDGEKKSSVACWDDDRPCNERGEVISFTRNIVV